MSPVILGRHARHERPLLAVAVAVPLLLLAVQFCLGSVGDTDFLKGHLEPFGYQRPADYPIDVCEDPFALSPAQFYEQYVATRRPLVFRGAAKHFKAFSQWSKRSLIEKYGSLELRIEPRRDGSSINPIGALGMGRDLLSNFVENMETSDNYVVSELPVPMYGDVELLPCMSCGRLRNGVSEINLWMSGGGTRSRLHRDAFNAINCQINGTKDWIMVPANQTDNVYFKAGNEWELGGLSPINTDSVNLKKYPRARDVPWGIKTLEAGDCIFIPGGHYHQVRSYGMTNVAVSVLFSRLELNNGLGFDASECDGVDMSYVPLDTVPDILWQYPGSGMMSMGRMDNGMLIAAAFDLTDGKPIPKKVLMESPETPLSTTGPVYAKRVWDLLDTDEDGILTYSDVKNISRENWRVVCRLMEPDVVYSNSYEYEFTQLDYDTVRSLMRLSLRNHKELDEEAFLTMYTELVGGSPYYGKKIFKQLDKEKKGVVTYASLKDGRLEDVLQPFLMQEEDVIGNHEADGDGEGDDLVRLENADYLVQLVIGRSERDIEQDPNLSSTERDAALEDYQERFETVHSLLGVDGEDSNGGGNKVRGEDVDVTYQQHMERLGHESRETGARDTVELEEVTPYGDDDEDSEQEHRRNSKTDL